MSSPSSKTLVYAKSPDNSDEFEASNLGGAVADYSGVRVRPLSVFLAGGISGVKDDWQNTVIEFLQTRSRTVDRRLLPHDNRILVVYNPRRKEYTPGGQAAYHQIGWEHRHLKHADAVSFWFPPDTLCPITLFELGSVLSSTERKILLGVHPQYARAEDVRLQTIFRHPTLVPRIVDNIPDLADRIWNWFITAE
jgi:hypothetical protein